MLWPPLSGILVIASIKTHSTPPHSSTAARAYEGASSSKTGVPPTIMPAAQFRPAPRAVDEAPRPSFGMGADGPPPPDKATDEDRKWKRAYGFTQLRSPYLLQIDVPPSVAPGDVATARAIHRRIETALEQMGKWTKSERQRLRNLSNKWGRRASGTDVYFNLHGWTQDHVENARSRNFARTIDTLRRTIGE